MARSLNKVMLIGHLGADPELRYTPSGVPVATFRIATNETWRDADGNLQERTEWHTIVVWRKLAELTNDLLKKGSRVYVEGRIQSRTYEDKNGIRRTVTEIVADDIILLDSKTSSDSSLQAQQRASAVQDTSENITNDEFKSSIIPPEILSDDETSQKDDDLPF
ncbi:MAG: single-stranded DNA-binding protein [Candidatus Kryptonium sp.]|nr:single-stranded DNA-binding protein [Candidatus Kryptonium sp.]MDW8109925.1 single-stranded DNA-binding protein [Candidatus Kryptonium sp.]